MRTLRALALTAVLTVSSGTAVFASGDGGSYAQPGRPAQGSVRSGDGGSYAQPARPAWGTVQSGDGGSYSMPTEPVDVRYGEVWA